MKTVALALLLLSAVDSGHDSAVRLIAHRGGVVDALRPENSLPALEEAIRQGYWMVEVDLQRSRDGVPFLQHDDSFLHTYGVRKKAADLDWEEIRGLRSRVGGQSPCCFAEYAEKCRGKIRVMIDCKETAASGGFFEKVENILRANDLLGDALFIGSSDMKAHFKGKARIGTDRNGLRRAVGGGEDVRSLYFLFEHGNELDDAEVKFAQSVDVPVIPTVNDFHYLLKKHASTPESDIARLKEDHVNIFQIDSAYSGYCRQHP